MIYNRELEIKVLGLCLIYPELFKKHDLTKKLFFSTDTKKLYNLINKINEDNGDFTDLEILRAKGADMILVRTAMETESFRKTHFEQDYKELLRLAIYRSAIDKIYKLDKKAKEMPEDVGKFLSQADGTITDILEDFVIGKSPHIKDILRRLIEYKNELKKNPDVVIKTGFEKIDNLTGGLMPRNVWILGSWTNSGKTFWALQVLLNALKQNKKCLLFSLEMSDIMNTARMLGNISNCSSLEILHGQVDERIDDSINWMAKQPLIIYDNKMTLDEIRKTSRKHSLLDGIDFIIIDYVQNIQDDSSEYETMSKAAIATNTIAQENNVAVLIISQISQSEAMRSKKDGIITMKGSGGLMASPDVGLYLERLRDETDEIVPDRMICRIAKNRHGGLGKVFLKISPEKGYFIEQDPNQNS